MTKKFILVIYFLNIIAGAYSGNVGIRNPVADIIVYGATPSGIMAAYSASKEGARVLLIEPQTHIGGMVTGGLGRTDVSGREFVGGYTAVFFNEVASFTPQEKQTPNRPWDLEAKVAEQVFKKWLEQSGAQLFVGRRIVAVRKEKNRIVDVTLDDGKTYAAKIFIDASYEGDLMAKAGVDYVIGREPSVQYKEHIAGAIVEPTVKYKSSEYQQACSCMEGAGEVHYLHNSQFGADIPANHNGTLMHGINPGAPVEGAGDKLIQGYNYRITCTNKPGNKVPWSKPLNYYPERYRLLTKYIQAHPGISFTKLVHFGRLPNDKYDLNANGPFTTDYIGGNTGYPDGDHEERARIRQDHEDYVKGFLWFLATDKGVPAKLRKEVNQWGLCKDEFKDNGHWPYQLYVREGRRMKGEFVMTQKDVTTDVLKSDAVGMGSFAADAHPVQRWVDKTGNVKEEGHFLLPTKPYQIPYRSITPKKSECENLLVPVCLSASHVAYCSIRMEPVYMLLGHAAGLAAFTAAKDGVPVQSIDLTGLQHQLMLQGQKLSK